MKMTKKLQKLRKKLIDNVVVPLLPDKYANLLQCSKGGLWDSYFADAEAAIQTEWD